MFTVRYDVNIQVFIVRNFFIGFVTYRRVHFLFVCKFTFTQSIGPSVNAQVRLIFALCKHFLHLPF
jgi:hypothetical protein